jgi:ubiquinol-cytochrome c reductase cytochrome b subunit
MAFVEKKLPADAPVVDKALNWVDSRFPLTKLWNDQWGKYYAPKISISGTSSVRWRCSCW